MSGLIFVFNYVSAQTYKIICKFFLFCYIYSITTITTTITNS